MKFKCAIIGCGRMGARPNKLVEDASPKFWRPLSHIDAIVANDKLELKSICDVDRSRLDDVAEEYRVKNAFTSYRDLLERGGVDLLTIATRTLERAKILSEAYKSGIRAFHIEKPLCNSVAELKSLSHIFLDDEVYITLGAIRRYLPPYEFAKTLVNQGVIGELRQIQVNYGYSSLYWSHPHSVDLLLYFAGCDNIQYVQSKMADVEYNSDRQIVNDPLVEWGVVGFGNGITGIITSSPGWDVVLSGSMGKIVIEANGSRMISYLMRGDSPYYKPEELHLDQLVGHKGGTYLPIEELRKCLGKDRDAISRNATDKKDIFVGQAILFALLKSAENNSSKQTISNVLDTDMTILGATDGKFA